METRRDLLRDALRMLEAPRVPRDDIRIARSKYKLSVVLNALHDPHAQTLREDAIDLCDTLSSTSLTDNDIFDDLVAYT